MNTKFDTRQTVHRSPLSVFATPANTFLSTILTDTNSELDVPLRLFATLVPDANLNIRASITSTGDGGQKSVPSLNGTVFNIPDSTINFQTGTTTGATFLPNSGAGTITLPSATTGNYVRAGFTLLSTGVIQVAFSTQSATLVGLANPGTLFMASGLALGWIDLQNTGGTSYKTANSTTNIIENAPGGVAAIHRFEIAAGVPGASASNKTYPNVFLSPAGFGDTTTLHAALGLLPVGGGIICVMDNYTLSTMETLPSDVMLLGRNKSVIITVASGGGLIVSGTNVTIKDLSFFTSQTALSRMIDVQGDLFNMYNCSFDCSSATSTNVFVYVESNDSIYEANIFHKTVTTSTNTGLFFQFGFSGNLLDKNIFTT